MDDTRIHRRMRPRPYDLRRKVLLKNFLRDQMTYIPETNKELFPMLENPEEPSCSDKDSPIHELDKHASLFTAVDGSNSVQSIPSSSNDSSNVKHNYDDEIDLTDIIDVETISDFDIPVNSNHSFCNSSGLVKFTGLFKKDSKSTTSKHRFKSKKVCKNSKSPIKTRSFKKSFEKVFHGHKRSHGKISSNSTPKSSSRSLFNMFKQRRDLRRAKANDKIKKSSDNQNNSVPVCTLNQSVQTDDSWVKEEMNKVHQSNKRLKEENKLLSESLSYFMSNASMDPQIRQSDSPFQSSNENSLMFHDYTLPPISTTEHNSNLRSRVSRSKSVHECNERFKVTTRNNYRTKSMNVHNSRNYFLTNSRPLLSSYNEGTNIPRLRKKTILTNIPNSSSTSSNRIIQRRSSMPERTLSENNRWATHSRSNSMRSSHARKPFYALSADAFY